MTFNINLYVDLFDIIHLILLFGLIIILIIIWIIDCICCRENKPISLKK